MLDPRDIAADPQAIKDNLARRYADDSVLSSIDQVVALVARRSELIQERDELRNLRNVRSKEIGQLYKQGRRDDAEAAKAEVQRASSRFKIIEEELAGVEAGQHDALMHIPNVVDAEVPAGRTEDDNLEVRRWGTPRTFDGPAEAHVEIGERLGIVDFERSAKLSGARFWVLTGLGARLERALINFFLDIHTGEHGYTEVMVPYIVQRHALEGTGQLPKFEADLFKLAAPLNGEDAYLVPTAEVPVTNLVRDEILDEAALPLKYACFTPCFRSEAGAHGRDVRGLMRVHQFHKVELVWITAPEASGEAHEALLADAESMLQRLEIPYRVELLCGGDTSFSAHKCYDLEVWMPSQERYREISSVSNFHDFQARRMAARYRPAADDGHKHKPRLVHTLNGSGLAVGRTVVAILENYVQPDGSVVIPTALRPWMGGVEVIPAPAPAGS